jgi:hypothetical protein
MRLLFDRASVIRFLASGVVILVVAHLVTQTISLLSGHDVIMGLIPLFNLNAEANIPTLFSTLLLLFASALLLINAALYKMSAPWFVKYWVFLAALFAFLAIDELSALHERLTVPVRQTLETDGLLYFAWVIPYAVLVLGVGLLLLKFMLRIDRRIAVGFVASGVIYISGAVGMEMMGSQEAFALGQSTVTFILLSTIEEVMEMCGVILFINYVLRDIFSRTDDVGIAVGA